MIRMTPIFGERSLFRYFLFHNFISSISTLRIVPKNIYFELKFRFNAFLTPNA